MDLRKKYEKIVDSYAHNKDKQRFLRELMKLSIPAADSHEHDIFDGMPEYFIVLGDEHTIADFEKEIRRLQDTIELHTYMVDFFQQMISGIQEKQPE